MSEWPKELLSKNRTVKVVFIDEVYTVIEGEFQINRVHRYNPDGTISKSYELNCGWQDGECIDIFDLQKWFDDNREWINSLREECKE